MPANVSDGALFVSDHLRGIALFVYLTSYCGRCIFNVADP